MKRYQCLPRTEVQDEPYMLRAVQQSDIESIRQWRNAQMEVLRQASPISRDEQEAYFASSIWPSMNLEFPSNILLTFFENAKRIGYGGLVHVAWEHRRAEVSFLVDPAIAAIPQAYEMCFSRFLHLLKSIAFFDLSLERLFTETFCFREHHIFVLESNGFQLEGRLRRHVQIRGMGVDSLIHGCLKTYD